MEPLKYINRVAPKIQAASILVAMRVEKKFWQPVFRDHVTSYSQRNSQYFAPHVFLVDSVNYWYLLSTAA